jgi:hypothetical protein
MLIDMDGYMDAIKTLVVKHMHVEFKFKYFETIGKGRQHDSIVLKVLLHIMFFVTCLNNC